MPQRTSWTLRRPVGYAGAMAGQGGHYAQDSVWDEQEADLQRELADKQNLGQRLRQQRFEAVFPWMQQQAQAQFGAQPTGTMQPRIDASPVWGQDQIQQAINAMGAQQQAETGAATRGMRERLAGRGFGSRSPLQALMESQLDMQGRARTADQSRQFRQDASQINAQQRLAGQQAQEAQYANRQRENIDRQRALVGLMGTMGGII